jgi:hypothetical protein
MSRNAVAGAAWVLGALLPTLAQAQTPEADITAGNRIRYRLGDGSKAKAVVVEAGEDWLNVQRSSGPVQRIDRRDLKSLSVLRGKRRHALGGTAIGFGIGAGLGYALDQALCDYGSDCNEAPAMLLVGAMGGALGGLVGALIRTDRWQDVSPATVLFGMLPARGGGLRVAVGVTF